MKKQLHCGHWDGSKERQLQEPHSPQTLKSKVNERPMLFNKQSARADDQIFTWVGIHVFKIYIICDTAIFTHNYLDVIKYTYIYVFKITTNNKYQVFISIKFVNEHFEYYYRHIGWHL